MSKIVANEQYFNSLVSTGVPGSRPSRVAVRCGLEQVTFTPCLVLAKPMKQWMYD